MIREKKLWKDTMRKKKERIKRNKHTKIVASFSAENNQF
jgi:hypothetical protein